MRKPKKLPELTLGEQVNILFHFGQQQGLAVDYRSVANATGVSVNNLHKIRNGENDNPGIQTLRKLASYFNVPLAYFDNKTREQCWAHVQRRARQGAGTSTGKAKSLVVPIDGISEEGRQVIKTVLKYIRRKEGVLE
ncbi:MAG: helix-turn-helix transcriptional regulator [Chloroflexota bacterium]